jgi:hypothetical protein
VHCSLSRNSAIILPFTLGGRRSSHWTAVTANWCWAIPRREQQSPRWAAPADIESSTGRLGICLLRSSECPKERALRLIPTFGDLFDSCQEVGDIVKNSFAIKENCTQPIPHKLFSRVLSREVPEKDLLLTGPISARRFERAVLRRHTIRGSHCNQIRDCATRHRRADLN